MDIPQIAFILVTLGFGLWAAYSWPPTSAKLGTIALSIAVLFLGPRVLGPDWYHEGYIAGLLLGDFVGTAIARSEATDRQVGS